MPPFYVSTRSPDDWRGLLADPDKHWKRGYSAHALAHCWEEAKGFPASIQHAFSRSGIAAFEHPEILVAIPEHQVSLPGGPRPSQNDIWILARSGAGLLSIAVEGKVAESFGPTLAEWRRNASTGKQERLSFLGETLGITAEPSGAVRYQLLHRAASAILEAKRFEAVHALMLVHTFNQEGMWFEDYRNFLSLFSVSAAKEIVQRAGTRGSVDLYFAWVTGEAQYVLA